MFCSVFYAQFLFKMVFAPTNVWRVSLVMRPQTLVRLHVKCALLVPDVNFTEQLHMPKLCFQNLSLRICRSAFNQL